MERRYFPAKKIAVIALFTALSLIVFIIENLLPPMFVPGAKLGLANIFSLATLILYGPAEAFIVLLARTVLGSLFAGNVSMLIYSLSGGLVSMAVSAILVYIVYPRVSVMAVSMASAVLHTVIQYIVFMLLTATPGILYYMPFAALVGILSGGIVGAVVMLLFKKVPTNVFMKAAFNGKVAGGESHNRAEQQSAKFSESSVADSDDKNGAPAAEDAAPDLREGKADKQDAD